MMASPTYFKLADEIFDLIAQADNTTPMTQHVLNVLLRFINRKTNHLRMTVGQLAEAAGISTRSILRHTAILETLEIVQVKRSKNGARNAINIYSLCGIAREVACWNGHPTTSPGSIPLDSVSVTLSQLNEKGSVTLSHDLTNDFNQMNHDDEQLSDSTYLEEEISEDFSPEASIISERDWEIQQIRENLQKRGARDKALNLTPEELETTIERAWEIANEKATGNRVGYALAVLRNGDYAALPQAKPQVPQTNSNNHPVDPDTNHETDNIPEEHRKGYEILREFDVYHHVALQIAYAATEIYDVIDNGWRKWFAYKGITNTGAYLAKMVREKKRPPFYNRFTDYDPAQLVAAQNHKNQAKSNQQTKAEKDGFTRSEDADTNRFLKGKWAAFIES